MIQINPLKSYIDGGVRAALTTPPSASLVFDLPGKAIWVKGVKLKGTDHTYTFSHDNYITLTNTPDSNESEDIKIGVNTSALKSAIDTTYGVVSTTTNGLAPKFTSGNKLAASAATTYYFLGWAGSTLKWYQAPFRNIRINSETTDCLGVNNTDPLIIGSGNGISVTWDSTNKKIIITNTKPDVNHNTHYTTMLYIGENNDTKANKNIANPYLKLFDDNARRSTFQIKAGSGIAVASDTNGNITITNSSPDVNHNTDYRVTQSETTTANYRPLVVGYTSVNTAGSGMTGSVTNQVYVSNKFYVQPSTGNLYATTFVGALLGNASTATALTTNAGNSINPVYFSGGKPIACTMSTGRRDGIVRSFGRGTYTSANLYFGNGTIVAIDPTGTGCISANDTILSLGDLPNRNTQLLVAYDRDGVYYRRIIDNLNYGNWKRLAFTTDIPTVTNYYWANIKVSDSSSTSTSPTFGNFYGKLTAKDNTAANALLHSGTGRPDSSTGDTWIFVDDLDLGNWGIKHDLPGNNIDFYGLGKIKFHIPLYNEDAYSTNTFKAPQFIVTNSGTCNNLIKTTNSNYSDMFGINDTSGAGGIYIGLNKYWIRTGNASEHPKVLRNGTAYTLWHAGNDGSGSGLDADLLDGNHASAFATVGHNHDRRYVYNYGGTQMDGTSINKNALGMTTSSGISEDWWHILQAAWNGEYRWNSLIAFPTLNRNGVYYRSGLDDNTTWGAWVKLLDVNNYASILDSRYYTESEVNNLLANYYPITGGNMSGDNRWIGSTMGGGSDYWSIGGSGSGDTGTCIITIGDNYDDKFAVEINDWQGNVSRPLEVIYTGINTLNIYANGTYRLLYSNSANGSVIHSILNYNLSPYGLLTRIYNDGCVSLQSQRESSNSEVFSLSLNPLGGNVGISTTSPSYKLDVNGLIHSAFASNNGNPCIMVNPTNDTDWCYGIEVLATKLTAGHRTGAYWAGKANSTNNAICMSYYHAGDGSGDNRLIWHTWGSGDKMVLTASGNVGIGATNPSSKLTINGVGNDKSPVQLINASRDSTWVYNASFLAPNLTNNHNNAIFIGKSHSTCNAFGLTHMHIGDGYSSNYAAFEVWGVGNVLRWYYDRHSAFLHRTDFASLDSNTSYMSSALLIREHAYGGAQADSWANAPRLSWHWEGRVQTQIGLGSNNELYLSKNQFNNYYRLVYETGTWGINITGNANSASNSDMLDGYHADSFIKKHTEYNFSSNGTAPYNYVWLCRIGNTHGYSGMAITLDVNSRYHKHYQINMLISTGQYAYSSSSISINKSDGAPNVYYVRTANGSDVGYDYFDIYVTCSAWNTGGYKIMQTNVNGGLQFTNKCILVDSVPSGAVAVGLMYSSVNYATSAGNADTLDGYHANRLLTALSNSNNGVSITVGGTTKSISNISVNYANSAGNANTVDGQHFNWNNNKNDHTYLWAASDNGNAYLVHRASISVNHANSADRASYLSGHGVSPNNSHPGHGARVFYSWNIGQVGNDTSGYSNGITIGSHPNDTAYGFQIVQNMWDDRTYTRRYNGGWQSWKTLAWTSDIPTVTDYYWANIKISTSSNTSTNPTFASLFINTGDPTLKIYSGIITDAVSDGNICLLTSIDGTDGQSHAYPTQYGSRCNLVLQPRGGLVYIGTNPNGGNTAYKLYVNGNVYASSFTGNASSATNADKVDGYHASSLWRSDGATWNPGANVSLNASGNNQEWSFDIRRNGYTGCYWHVWDSSLNTMLKVNADNGKVYAPYNFVGNLEGNASSATTATYLNVQYCRDDGSPSNKGLWNTIKNGTTNAITNRVRFYTIYGTTTALGAPTDGFGELLEICSYNTNHWQPLLWFGSGKNGRLYYRNKNYNDNSWGSWRTVAWTSEIPTVTNYYWANVKISASSSTNTSPTFSTCYTSNWFRSTGSTGWYNETYSGGWYMNDTTWIRTWNSKGIYTSSGTIYTAGHAWLATSSDYKVGIGTTSPSYKLHVAGDSYTSIWSRAGSGFYCEGTGVHFTRNSSATSAGEIDMTSNNEFCWGSSNGSLYFNYRGVSRGKTVTNYIWNAGSSSSYASHTMGHITLGSSGYLLKRVGYGVSWIKGRDSAIVRQTSASGYSAVISSKTTNGSWEIGNYTNLGNSLYFTYITDSNYNSGNNTFSGQVYFDSNSSVYATHFYEKSDIRYKRILKNLLINSNTIANLPLFDFEWIENNTIGTGTSALAVLKILPNIVSGNEKLTLDYGVLGTIAGITACKELVKVNNEIFTLKSEIEQLKEKVKLLEDKLRKYAKL